MLYSSYRPGQLATMGPLNVTGSSGTATLDRHSLAQRSSSLRRARHLLQLEARALSERTQAVQADRARVLEINPAGTVACFENKLPGKFPHPPISQLLTTGRTMKCLYRNILIAKTTTNKVNKEHQNFAYY